MPPDPFPRERVGTMLHRMPAYLRLAWRLARDPLLSRARRAAVVGAAGYLVSPIDLVPGVVPVIGQLDDLAVALAAIRLALSGLDPDRRRLHLDAVGLQDDDLVADLRTIGATTAWLGRAGYRASKSVAVASGRAAASGAETAARTTKAVAGRAAPAAGAMTARATPAAKAAAAKAAPVAKAVTARATPAVKAVSDRAAPAAKATGRVAKDAGTKAAAVGGRALGAAGAALRGLPGRRGPSDPTVTVTEVELPLLPPPPPDRGRG